MRISQDKGGNKDASGGKKKSGVNRTISARGGERGGERQQRERERGKTDLVLRERGVSALKAEKFDDDHDYDG